MASCSSIETANADDMAWLVLFAVARVIDMIFLSSSITTLTTTKHRERKTSNTKISSERDGVDIEDRKSSCTEGFWLLAHFIRAPEAMARMLQVGAKMRRVGARKSSRSIPVVAVKKEKKVSRKRKKDGEW